MPTYSSRRYDELFFADEIVARRMIGGDHAAGIAQVRRKREIECSP